MKQYSILGNIFSTTLAYTTASCIAATDLTDFDPAMISVPSEKGAVSAFLQVTALAGHVGNPIRWITNVHTAYIPTTGNGWAGVGFGWNIDPQQAHLALVDGWVLGITTVQPEREILFITISTNLYPAGQTNVSSVMQALFMKVTNNSKCLTDPPYAIALRRLLGLDLFGEHAVRFKSLTVEGTNAVVTLEVGTNTVARVAFTKEIIPVWATTNGVSIGQIPTNCVIYSNMASNKMVTKVVY